jgi:hypothetical protein
MPQQLNLLSQDEPTVNLPEANKLELINAFAQLVSDFARHRNNEEAKEDERQDNH